MNVVETVANKPLILTAKEKADRYPNSWKEVNLHQLVKLNAEEGNLTLLKTGL